MKTRLTGDQIEKLRASVFFQRRLAIQAYDWTAAIERLCERVGNAGDERPEPYQTDLHMLALSLEHLDSCIRLLGDAGILLNGASPFLKAWESVSDVRDALEHEEEYLAGGGLRLELIGPGWSEIGRPTRSTIWGAPGPTSISALGKSYRVGQAIKAASQLEEELAALAQRLDAEARRLVPGNDTQD